MSATNKKDEWREVCVERKSLCGFAGFSQMRERVGICSIIGEELQRSARCTPQHRKAGFGQPQSHYE